MNIITLHAVGYALSVVTVTSLDMLTPYFFNTLEYLQDRARDASERVRMWAATPTVQSHQKRRDLLAPAATAPKASKAPKASNVAVVWRKLNTRTLKTYARSDTCHRSRTPNKF